MKFLSRMLEGYQHFVSLRKASYRLIDEQLKFRDNNVNKKIKNNL